MTLPWWQSPSLNSGSECSWLLCKLAKEQYWALQVTSLSYLPNLLTFSECFQKVGDDLLEMVSSILTNFSNKWDNRSVCCSFCSLTWAVMLLSATEEVWHAGVGA